MIRSITVILYNTCKRGDKPVKKRVRKRIVPDVYKLFMVSCCERPGSDDVSLMTQYFNADVDDDFAGFVPTMSGEERLRMSLALKSVRQMEETAGEE